MQITHKSLYIAWIQVVGVTLYLSKHISLDLK